MADVAVPRPVLAHELHGFGLRGVWGGWVRVAWGVGRVGSGTEG